MHLFSVDTASPFYTSILEQPLLAYLWQINQKIRRNFGGRLKSSNRVGVGKCYGSPPTALRSSQNTLIFVFYLKPGWRSNERALLHRWTHRYESIQSSSLCVCMFSKTKSQQSHLLILTWVSLFNLVTRIIVY